MAAKYLALPPLPVPFDGTPDELIQAARHVEALREHPGYKALTDAAEGLAAMKANGLSMQEPSANPAVYADVVGECRGLRSVDRLAQGVIENAKVAEREQRGAEDGGS